MKMTEITPAAEPVERKNKRRPVVAVILAALAVGGIGAAATSAAWTDNTFFSAQAGSATFDLKGSLNGTDWVESDNASSIQLVIPAEQLANLLPGQTRTIPLYVENTGSVSAALTASAAFATGADFVTAPTVTLDGVAATLTPASGASAQDTFNLVVTTPADWAPANQGKTGSIIVTIGGTATA